MSYEKQTWKNGDIITEDKLNHIEDGIAEVGSSGGGGGMAIHINTVDSAQVMDKTWQEITDAISAGIIPIVVESYPPGVYLSIVIGSGFDESTGYYVNVDVDTSIISYATDSVDGYPSIG